MHTIDRYHRQTLLPQIGHQGQRRLAESSALLIGCGALGTTIADQLARAGVGHLILVDRDIVELTNLQRQTLFDERDVREAAPKAVAAARRLREINSSIEITPVVSDVHPGSIQELLREKVDLIVDGTDNVATRYLINDLATKHRINWIYGAAVGVEGRVFSIIPSGPCLRCVFPTPPSPGELPTCDTAGVLGMNAAIVGSMQAIEALRILTDQARGPTLLKLDPWAWRFRSIDLSDARNSDCPCCGKHDFEFLNAPSGQGALTLCGRNAVQVRPAHPPRLHLDEVATRLSKSGRTEKTPWFIRCILDDPAGISLTLFQDGRALIHGTSDLVRAKSIYARFIGQ